MTGEDLKKRREELGLSLTEVSLVTKISLRVLHAIEAMDKTQLPAEIFLKGLVKSYALHLKLDADTVTKNYVAQVYPPKAKPMSPTVEASVSAPVQETPVEHQVEKPIVEPAPAAEYQTSPRAPTAIPTKVIWISVAIVGLIAVIAIAQFMNRYQSDLKMADEQKPVEKPVEKTAEAPASQEIPTIPIIPSESNKPTADNAGVVAPSVPAPAPMPMPVQSANTVPEPVPVQPQTPPKPEEVAKVEEKKPEEKKPEEKPVVAAVPPAPKPEDEKPKEPEKKPAAVAVGKKELILEALDKVSIVIKKGSKQYKVSLQPDEIHTVQYSDTIEVEISDGGAVNVIQNGHDNGVAGDLGKPKKMSL